MKKLLSVFIAITIALTFTIYANAGESSNSAYTVDQITVNFSESTTFTAEEQALITQFIVNGSNNSSATTYNLMCTLFGHKTTTETIGVIEHCVSDTAPRCIETIQDVTACSRCDYVTTDVISSYYIFCCD